MSFFFFFFLMFVSGVWRGLLADLMIVGIFTRRSESWPSDDFLLSGTFVSSKGAQR